MMNIPITAITAGLLALFLIALTIRVVKLRRQNQVSLGDGGNETLRRAIRGHANLTEYAPIGIVLLLIAELQSVTIIWMTVLAAMLLAGRVAHGYAFAFAEGNMTLRTRGMQLTLFAIAALAITNLAMVAVDWITG